MINKVQNVDGGIQENQEENKTHQVTVTMVEDEHVVEESFGFLIEFELFVILCCGCVI